ncbi:hypothetical protein GCM10009738_34370 [Kitasatospora viridis]
MLSRTLSIMSIGEDWCTTASDRLVPEASVKGSPPNTLTVPLVGRVTPQRSLTSVVLPAPLGPSSPTDCPSSSVALMSSMELPAAPR